MDASEIKTQQGMRLFAWEHDIGCFYCGFTHPRRWARVWYDRMGAGACCSSCADLPARSKARRLRDLARDDVAA